MESRTDAIRGLTKAIHAMRPEWDTGGIRKILDDDDRPFTELAAIAIAVANDPTARTPAVIRTKEMDVPGIAGRPPSMPMPPSVAEVISAPTQPDGVAIAGAKRVREATEAAAIECADNRAAVLAYDDLAAMLTKPPLSYARPEQWNGYVPPRTDANGTLNTSRRRVALVALVQTARSRKGTDEW